LRVVFSLFRADSKMALKPMTSLAPFLSLCNLILHALRCLFEWCILNKTVISPI
jgi:hypothetical protein